MQISSNTTNPARLVVKDIGNAAAVPVGVKIGIFLPSSVKTGPRIFGAGLCQAVINSGECQLKPSAGVAVANTSLVQMSQYPEPPPLYTTTLATTGSAPPIGAQITVQVGQSFNANNQAYRVFKTGTTTVKACN